MDAEKRTVIRRSSVGLLLLLLLSLLPSSGARKTGDAIFVIFFVLLFEGHRSTCGYWGLPDESAGDCMYVVVDTFIGPVGRLFIM